jgi:hypothetical protein
VTNVCDWCRREGQGRSPEESGVIVGLCDDHIRRFNEEIETALRGRGANDRESRPLARTRRAAGVSRAVLDKVADVLVRNTRTDLCDRCIAEDVGCSVSEAGEAAVRLAGSPDFLRDQWRCGRCASRQTVTRARSRVIMSRSASPSSAA